jgi:hypothetical protein
MKELKVISALATYAGQIELMVRQIGVKVGYGDFLPPPCRWVEEDKFQVGYPVDLTVVWVTVKLSVTLVESAPMEGVDSVVVAINDGIYLVGTFTTTLIPKYQFGLSEVVRVLTTEGLLGGKMEHLSRQVGMPIIDSEYSICMWVALPREASVWRASIYKETGAPAPAGARSGLSVLLASGGWLTFTNEHHDSAEMTEILSKNPQQLSVVLDHSAQARLVGDRT